MEQPYYHETTLPTTCGLHAPKEKEMESDKETHKQKGIAERTYILSSVWDRAYFAALTGLAGDKDVRESWTEAAIIANATVAAWPAMTAERDALIRKAVDA